MQIGPQIDIPRGEFVFRFDRSSGPGGQNVNKVNSKATMHWQVRDTPSLPEDVRQRFLSRFATRINKSGELVISSQQHRDQAQNTDECLRRVRTMIEQVLAKPKRRKKTRPTLASKRRRLDNKKRRSETKRLRKPPRD